MCVRAIMVINVLFFDRRWDIVSFSTCLTIWGVWFTVWLDWMHIVCTVCCTISGSWAIRGKRPRGTESVGWVGTQLKRAEESGLDVNLGLKVMCVRPILVYKGLFFDRRWGLMPLLTCLAIWEVWLSLWCDWVHIVSTVSCKVWGSWASGSEALLVVVTKNFIFVRSWCSITVWIKLGVRTVADCLTCQCWVTEGENGHVLTVMEPRL